MPPVFAKIDAESFKQLINGEAVELAGRGREGPMIVKLILEDIGFEQMIEAITQAVKNAR